MKRAKFNTKKHPYKGMMFDSELELKCYRLCEHYEPQGWFKLTRQVSYQLLPEQPKVGVKRTVEEKVCYFSDIELELTSRPGIKVVIDVKSKITAEKPDYIIKRKLMLFFKAIQITEVKSVSQMEDVLTGLRNI